MARRTQAPADPEQREDCRRQAATFLRYAYVARPHEAPDFGGMGLPELRREANRMQADPSLPTPPVKTALRALDAAEEGRPFVASVE